MKKIIALFLVVIMAAAFCAPAFAAKAEDTFGKYDHVFIIGVDGAGRFFEDADTPNFDRIFADGAVDYTARAEIDTTSAQNWGAILTGVSYTKHNMSNGSTGETERSSDTEFPTIFTLVRKAMPDAQLASIVNWNNINFGIIENDIDVYKDHGSDAEVCDKICDYFNAGNAPALFFVQFDSVDHVGHELGSGAPEFYEQIATVDGYLGRIYDTLVENGLMENGLFIVTSDHGHTPTGGHGGITMRETNVTVAAAGKTVVKGGKMPFGTRNRDIAAIALYALGIDKPSYMTAIVPANLFDGVPGQVRPIFNDLGDFFRSMFTWIATVFTAFQ